MTDTTNHETNAIGNVVTERGKRYGKFTDHARVTQNMKIEAYTALQASGAKAAPDQCEAIDMILHKIGRIVCGDPDYADSWRDIEGYAKLVADRLDQDAAIAAGAETWPTREPRMRGEDFRPLPDAIRKQVTEQTVSVKHAMAVQEAAYKAENKAEKGIDKPVGLVDDRRPKGSRTGTAPSAG